MNKTAYIQWKKTNYIFNEVSHNKIFLMLTAKIYILTKFSDFL